MFEVYITSLARKAIKKLPKTVKEEIVKICEEQLSDNPFNAFKLQKPLDECRSFHFSVNGVNYRIAYRIIEEMKRIDIILIATRENFYQKLKRALRL